MKKRKGDLYRARRLVRRATKDLRYELTEAQIGDLLADNFNDWPLDYIRHIVTEIGTFRGGIVPPAQKKQTHRELMYDPQCSGRRFRHFMRLTTSGAAMEEAWTMGQCAAERPDDIPKRWRTNPFPPGRRHDMYESGREATQRDRDEERTYQRWNRE